MPRKKWIDKNNATTFALLHRPQNDPKIHDEGSSSMVFQELIPAQARKFKSRNDLELELFGDSQDANASKIRNNEGEAAEYGIYFDDTEYDYMQHLRDLGSGFGNGESYFIEAAVSRKNGKRRQKMSLEDALREASIGDSNRPDDAISVSKQQENYFDEDMLPSKDLKRSTHQDQQDVPDILAGFQPDMDPRLREALEALDDEAYVDNEEDIFGELVENGEEVKLEEFEKQHFADAGEEDGWETDDTAKPANEFSKTVQSPHNSNEDVIMGDSADYGDGDWMKEFSKYKKTEKSLAARPGMKNLDLQSSIVTGTSMTGSRRKKRKGAMTSSTGYSMTSSSLFRTEGQTLLDAKFDKLEEAYAEDTMDEMDGGASIVTGSSFASRDSTASSQPQSVRSDFDSIMDDFLGGYSMSGKKRVKKGRYQAGMDQLDEIRNNLGPARIGRQRA
ncbi:MAG: hypothetical protein LQ342_000650 [Letrouitia transgressa]|nr:MAG: hypothetical protein LQ342_000650 [Letrouitia transgressa]